MNCVNCGGKPYAEDAIGLPYCKNCVADHHAFARRTLVGGYDPQSRERVAWASNPNTAPQGRVRGSNRVEERGVGIEKIREVRKQAERAEGKRKKAGLGGKYLFFMVLPSFKETAPYMADFGGSDGTAPVVGKGLKQTRILHEA